MQRSALLGDVTGAPCELCRPLQVGLSFGCAAEEEAQCPDLLVRERQRREVARRLDL